MNITPGEVKKVGLLARLDVSEEEVGPLTEHFNKILDHFSKMEELDLSGVSAFTVEDSEPIRLRKDEPVIWEGREAILSQSPSRDGDFIKVPKIGGGDA